MLTYFSFISLTLAVVLNALVAQAATSGAITVGTTTNRCLAVTGSTPQDGSKVQVANCAINSGAQTWTFAAASVSGKTLLKTTNNLCVDVPDGVAASGKAVQVWTCSSSNPNQFFIRDGNNIRWNASEWCLNVPQGVSTGYAAGITLQLYKCNLSGLNQRLLGPVAAQTVTTSKKTTTTGYKTTTTTTTYTTITSSTKKSSSSSTTKTTSPTTSYKTTTTTTTFTTLTPTTTPATTKTTTTSTQPTTTSDCTTITTTTWTTITSDATTSSTTTTTTTSYAPLATVAYSPKVSLTSIFNPNAKRMLAWGYDDRQAGGIGSGAMISTYHHWELGVVKQMPAKNAYIPCYWGLSKRSYWESATTNFNGVRPAAIMGFNEPDVVSQANMTPADAAKLFYSEVYQPYGTKGSNMISPAVAWDLDNWLTPFMKQYTALGGTIDAVGYHIYLGLNNDTDAAVAEVKRRITLVYKTYGKPIVLSELGLTSAGGGTDAQIKDFVNRVGYFLDNTNMVLAWALSAVFARGAGWDGYLNSDMAFFESNSTLTDLAQTYMTYSYNATTTVTTNTTTT